MSHNISPVSPSKQRIYKAAVKPSPLHASSGRLLQPLSLSHLPVCPTRDNALEGKGDTGWNAPISANSDSTKKCTFTQSSHVIRHTTLQHIALHVKSHHNQSTLTSPSYHSI
eukprot:745673-Hanusia_phi.AAC.1